MARIALVTKTINPNVLDLADTLSSQQNEVFLITSKNQTLPENANFQILTPYKKWSSLETLRLFPRLLSQLPDVIHFVFSEPNQKPTAAEWLLCQLIQPIPGKITAASFFFFPDNPKSFWLNPFLSSCHLITWASRAHLLSSKRNHKLSKHSIAEVLPPFFDLTKNKIKKDDTHESRETNKIELEKLSNTLQKYFIVPNHSDVFFTNADKEELFFDTKINFLFLSERNSLFTLANTALQKHDLSYFHMPSRHPEDIEYAISKSVAILLAFSDLSVLELQYYHQLARKTKTPLIIRPNQNNLFPGLVIPEKTGWILQNGEASLRELIHNNPGLSLDLDQNPIPNFQHDLIDSSVNELHRFYQRALAARS